MSAWPFIIFTVIVAVLVCAHFFLAYRAWRSSRGEQSSFIDPDYVKVEDYFARSFRLKVSEWLKLPTKVAKPDGTRMITKGNETILITPSQHYPPQAKSDYILVVEGNFKCDANCIFGREVYALGDASVSTGTRMQAIAVDGNLTLGSSVRVARWADSAGDMVIGDEAVVSSRATAGGTLFLGNGARAGSVFAPTVSTSRNHSDDNTEADDFVLPELEIPASGRDGSATGKTERLGVNPKMMSQLSPDCWAYHGDLKPSAAVHLKKKLIVKGDCVLPAGSVLDADIKAEGLVVIGEHSLCKGNVIAGGEIRFGPSCRFSGVIHAGQALQLSRGVRGGSKDAPVAAFAAEILSIQEEVAVHGKLASGVHVVVQCSRSAQQKHAAATRVVSKVPAAVSSS